MKDGKRVIVAVNKEPQSFNVAQVKKVDIQDPSPYRAKFLTAIIDPSVPCVTQFKAAKLQ